MTSDGMQVACKWNVQHSVPGALCWSDVERVVKMVNIKWLRQSFGLESKDRRGDGDA